MSIWQRSIRFDIPDYIQPITSSFHDLVTEVHIRNERIVASGVIQKSGRSMVEDGQRQTPIRIAGVEWNHGNDQGRASQRSPGAATWRRRLEQKLREPR